MSAVLTVATAAGIRISLSQYFTLRVANQIHGLATDCNEFYKHRCGAPASAAPAP